MLRRVWGDVYQSERQRTNLYPPNRSSICGATLRLCTKSILMLVWRWLRRCWKVAKVYGEIVKPFTGPALIRLLNLVMRKAFAIAAYQLVSNAPIDTKRRHYKLPSFEVSRPMSRQGHARVRTVLELLRMAHAAPVNGVVT